MITKNEALEILRNDIIEFVSSNSNENNPIHLVEIMNCLHKKYNNWNGPQIHSFSWNDEIKTLVKQNILDKVDEHRFFHKNDSLWVNCKII